MALVAEAVTNLDPRSVAADSGEMPATEILARQAASFPHWRRERLIDQAVRNVARRECESVDMLWFAPDLLRAWMRMTVDPDRYVPIIRSEFAHLAAEEAP